MNYIQEIRINENKKWDKIVKSFKRYDVNYLSGYVKALQIHGDGEPILIYFNNGKTKAINVIMKRDISQTPPFKNKLALNAWYDISTPLGYGGFWIEGDDIETVEENYIKYCEEKGFICEFIRFHLFSKYKDFFKGEINSPMSNVVLSLENPLEIILAACKHKVRTNLKRAIKFGLRVEMDSSGKRLNDFLDIYYGTMHRNCAADRYFFSEEFFKTINKLDNNHVYAYVMYGEEVISTELVLYGDENCYSFLGGTNKKFFNLRPNEFLKYEVIKWAKNEGLNRYILGGGCGEDDGLFDYKKSFAPEGVYKFYVGERIFDEEKYNKLLEIRNKEDDFDIETQFFPKYSG